MAKPIPIPVRQKVLERTLSGETTADLASSLGLSKRTLRHLRQRFRERGPEAVQPDYRSPKKIPHAFSVSVHKAALALRREHPTWGAVLIGIALRQRHPRRSQPSPRTLQRWFRDAGLGPAPKPKRPRQRSPRSTAPHQTWQVDASERIALADGSQISWLRVVDEATGAVLRTAIFPPSLLESGRSPSHTNGLARAVFTLGAA